MTKFGDNTTLAQATRIATVAGVFLTIATIVVSVLWTTRSQVVFLTTFATHLKSETERVERDSKERDAAASAAAKERIDAMLTLVAEQSKIASALLTSATRTEKDLEIIQRDLAKITSRLEALERSAHERRQ